MRKIGVFVVSAHFAFFVLLLFYKPQPLPKQPLKIQTVYLSPLPSVKVKARTSPQTIKLSSQKIAPIPPLKKQPALKIPPEKKPIPPVVKPSKPSPSKAPPPKPSHPPEKKPPPPLVKPSKTPPAQGILQIPDTLKQQLEESIKKIESPSIQTPCLTLTTPKNLPHLKIDAEDAIVCSDFAASLIKCFQESLELPEKGSVKVQLTLTQQGKLAHVQTLQSDSERNQKFLEKTLKEITFPPFIGNLKDEKEHSFTITFYSM